MNRYTRALTEPDNINGSEKEEMLIVCSFDPIQDFFIYSDSAPPIFVTKELGSDCTQLLDRD